MRYLLIPLILLFIPAQSFAAPPSFTVNMSEAVTVTGTPRIAVDVGGVTRYATYASGSGTSSLTFTYSPQEGDLDLDGISLSSPVDLNGGTITDLNGNPETNLTFTVPDTSGVKIDYPSLSMDFISDDYILSGTHYNSLTSFLSAAGGSFTRNSVATYFDSTGTMQTASADTPRLDYDPTTHAAKGILIEEQRTNYVSNSKAIGAVAGSPGTFPTGWSHNDSGFGSTASITGTGTINGLSYVDVHYQGTLPASGGWFTIVFGYLPTISATNTTNLSASVYLALVSGAIPSATGSFIVSEKSGTTYLSNKTLLSFSTASLTSTLARFSGTANPAQATADNVIGPRLIWSSNGVVTPFDFTLRVAAPQLEIGAFPTSFIPTTTAAVTRRIDVLTLPTGGWYGSSGHTLTASYSIPYMGGPYYPAATTLDDGTPNNAIMLFVSDISTDYNGIEIRESGTSDFVNAGSIYSSGTTAKQAVSYETDRARASVDGVIGGLDTSVTVPSVSLLRVGRGRGGWWPLNGTVGKIRYYPARVSDTQLQLLTQ